MYHPCIHYLHSHHQPLPCRGTAGRYLACNYVYVHTRFSPAGLARLIAMHHQHLQRPIYIPTIYAYHATHHRSQRNAAPRWQQVYIHDSSHAMPHADQAAAAAEPAARPHHRPDHVTAVRYQHTATPAQRWQQVGRWQVQVQEVTVTSTNITNTCLRCLQQLADRQHHIDRPIPTSEYRHHHHTHITTGRWQVTSTAYQHRPYSQVYVYNWLEGHTYTRFGTYTATLIRSITKNETEQTTVNNNATRSSIVQVQSQYVTVARRSRPVARSAGIWHPEQQNRTRTTSSSSIHQVVECRHRT